MNNSILTLKLRTKRDVLRARQRARQIARLLGYELLQQSWIAASVFELARKAVVNQRRAVLVIQLSGNLLRIALSFAKRHVPKDALLAFSLPTNPLTLDRNDLPWIVGQLNRLTPLVLFEEFHQQNLEILHLTSLLAYQGDRALVGGSAA